MPTNRDLDQPVPGRVQPRERVEERTPGSGITQRRCSFAPTSVQYAARPSSAARSARRRSWPAPGPRPGARSVSGTSAIQKSNLVDGDIERVAGRSGPAAAVPAGRVGETDDAGLGLQRPLQHGPEVAGRVAEAVLDPQPQPDLSRRRGSSPGRHRGTAASAGHRRARERGRSRSARVARRDDVALRGAPRSGSRTGGSAVGQRHLVALAGPASAGAADDDPQSAAATWGTGHAPFAWVDHDTVGGRVLSTLGGAGRLPVSCGSARL